ncbi:Ribosomal protein L11 methyltransferase [hydrothermal vent metagenome]|uniref:Ribosomal protein L11 methyltransferase n=1 Tax=hydrothermal vent metagenome TaxID=652676 RepID=A0A3B1BX54_9ZZZZ
MGKNWVKVMVKTEGAPADDVAGVLAEEFSVAVEVAPDNTVNLWVAEEAYGAKMDKSIIDVITGVFSGSSVTLTSETEKNHDWQEKWKEFLEPVKVGNSVVITPSWKINEVSKDKKTVVVIDPGMAFGTGNHATTEGCALLLERYCGMRVLDVGTGTGVLAILSAMLGAEEVIAIDNDHIAVAVARENVDNNGVSGKVKVLEGEIGVVNGKFNVVVANLFLGPLLSIAPMVKEVMLLGGVYIISGLRADQEKTADSAVRHEGFGLIDKVEKDGWVALAYRLSTPL